MKRSTNPFSPYQLLSLAWPSESDEEDGGSVVFVFTWPVGQHRHRFIVTCLGHAMKTGKLLVGNERLTESLRKKKGRTHQCINPTSDSY